MSVNFELKIVYGFIARRVEKKIESDKNAFCWM